MTSISSDPIDYPASGEHITRWDKFLASCAALLGPSTSVKFQIETAVDNSLQTAEPKLFLPMVFHAVVNGMLKEFLVNVDCHTRSPTIYLCSDQFERTLKRAGYTDKALYSPTNLTVQYISKMPNPDATLDTVLKVVQSCLARFDVLPRPMKVTLSILIRDLHQKRNPLPGAMMVRAKPRSLPMTHLGDDDVLTPEQMAKLRTTKAWNQLICAVKEDAGVAKIEQDLVKIEQSQAITDAKVNVLNTSVQDVDMRLGTVETDHASLGAKMTAGFAKIEAMMAGFITSGGAPVPPPPPASPVDQMGKDALAMKCQIMRNISMEVKFKLIKMAGDQTKTLKDMQDLVAAQSKKRAAADASSAPAPKRIRTPAAAAAAAAAPDAAPAPAPDAAPDAAPAPAPDAAPAPAPDAAADADAAAAAAAAAGAPNPGPASISARVNPTLSTDGFAFGTGAEPATGGPTPREDLQLGPDNFYVLAKPDDAPDPSNPLVKVMDVDGYASLVSAADPFVPPRFRQIIT